MFKNAADFLPVFGDEEQFREISEEFGVSWVEAECFEHCACCVICIFEMFALDLSERVEIFAARGGGIDLCHREDFGGHGGLVPKRKLLIEVEQTDGYVFDIAAERERGLVFLDGSVQVIEIEMVYFRDAFMNGALNFGIIGECEQDLECGKGVEPAFLFEQDGQFEISSGAKIISQPERKIELSDSRVVVLCCVKDFPVVIVHEKRVVFGEVVFEGEYALDAFRGAVPVAGIVVELEKLVVGKSVIGIDFEQRAGSFFNDADFVDVYGVIEQERETCAELRARERLVVEHTQEELYGGFVFGYFREECCKCK